MGVALDLRTPGFRYTRGIAAHGPGPRSVVLEPMKTCARPVLGECRSNGRSTGVDLIRCLAIVGVVGHQGVVLGDVEVDTGGHPRTSSGGMRSRGRIEGCRTPRWPGGFDGRGGGGGRVGAWKAGCARPGLHRKARPGFTP